MKTLVLGISGLFGGTFGHFLLESKRDITQIYVLIRSEQHIEKCRALGFHKYILADLAKDADKITQAIADLDIQLIVNMAEAQTVDRCKPLLVGLAASHKKSGLQTHLVNASVSWFCADITDWAGPVPVSDTDSVYELEKQQKTVFKQRQFDTILIDEADRLGTTETLLSLQVGRGLGFGRRVSDQIPYLFRNWQKTGVIRYIAPGSASWPVVHVEDLAELFLKVYTSISDGAELDHTKTGQYFADAGQLVWKDLSDSLAAEMHRRGEYDKAHATPWDSIEDACRDVGIADAQLIRLLWQSDVQTLGKRSRALGWTPRYDVHWLLQNFATEVDIVLEEDKSGRRIHPAH